MIRATRQMLEENVPFYCGSRVEDQDVVCVLRKGHDGEHRYADNLQITMLGCGNWRTVQTEARRVR